MEALQVSTWNDKRLDEGFKEVKGETRAGFARVDGEIKDVRTEMRDGFAKVDQRFEKVDQEFKTVRKEMKEGFAQTVTRGEMNERFNAVDKRLGDLTRWVQALVVVVGGAFVSSGLLG